MGESEAAGLLQGAEPALSWRGQRAWRVLDTHFHHGQRFWDSLRLWRADPQRPGLLHVVGLTDLPPVAEDLRCAAEAAQVCDANALLGQWLGLLPGFHRFSLDDGRVLLTLCVGQTAQTLRELRFQADTLLLHGPPAQSLSEAGWDLWQVKALARCARRGSRLAMAASSLTPLLPALRQCGFELDPAPADVAVRVATYQPRWVIKTTRQNHQAEPQNPGDCVVLGAGLAGASVAAALARRGWQVQVFDQAAAPASGASSLPAGLLVTHVSADDCALSRLSRSGLRLTLQQAEALLERGQDWDATGVLQRDLGAGSGLPKDWPEQGLAWSSPPRAAAHAPWQHGCSASAADLWHGMAAWIKPAALVQAWLASPGVRFVGGVQVSGLRRHRDAWELLGADHQALLATRRLVLAHAHGVQRLLQGCADVADLRNSALASLHLVPGQVSWGLRQNGHGQALPPFPVNGAGSLLPDVPLAQGMAWLAGATYDTVGMHHPNMERDHSKNLARLTQLLPAAAAALAPDFAQHRVRSWHNARCVSADRLPLVGPVHEGPDDGLWVCTGMGSRGLSFAVLCAELLAARWGAEPWPVPARLARALEPRRGRTSAAPNAL